MFAYLRRNMPIWDPESATLSISVWDQNYNGSVGTILAKLGTRTWFREMMIEIIEWLWDYEIIRWILSESSESVLIHQHVNQDCAGLENKSFFQKFCKILSETANTMSPAQIPLSCRDISKLSIKHAKFHRIFSKQLYMFNLNTTNM